MTHEQEQTERMAAAIAQRLQAQARDSQKPAAEDHLDADTIAAFVEGRVEEPGATLITSHLLVCSECRRASAKLIHLESVIAEPSEIATSSESPSPLRQFIDNLTSRILPTTEGDVVFAYEDPSSPSASSQDKAKHPAKSHEANDPAD